MDQDIIRIRREQWLRHKQQKQQDDSTCLERKRPVTSDGARTSNSCLSSKSPSEDEQSQDRKRRKRDDVPENNVVDLLSSSSDEDDAPPSLEGVSCFSICSYNLWFGPPHPKERMEYIANHIIGTFEPKPVMIGFQEVTAYFQQILFPILEQTFGYTILTAHSKQEEEREGIQYQCAIAVLTKSNNPNAIVGDIVDTGFLPFSNTIMNRGLLWVNVCLHRQHDPEGKQSSKYILFSTTHLESFVGHLKYDGKEQRQDQIIQASKFCTDYITTWSQTLDTAIITGDLNWDDERKRSKGLDEKLIPLLLSSQTHNDSDNDNSGAPSWMDAWLVTHPNKDGYTYDSKESPMLRGNLRRRFDRCLIHGPSSLTVKNVDMIGTEPIPAIQWNKELLDFRTGKPTGNIRTLPVLPSDHFGLHIKLQNQV